MKGPVFLTLASLAAQAVSAVPHRESSPAISVLLLTLRAARDHKHLHQRQAGLSGSVVTVTQTVVEPSAVIWVDDAGNTISTEIRGPPATPTVNTNNNPAPAAFAGNVNPLANLAVDATTSAPATSATPAAAGNGYGICYDMITGSGGSTACKTPDQIDKDFAFLAQNGYTQVRTYDIGCDVGVVAQKAGAHGMKAFLGINSVANVAGDLQKLIGYVNGNWANIDTINIGNEQVNQGAASVAQVTAAVDAGRGILKAAGFTGNVVTVDVFNQFIANPTLASTSDYVAANARIPSSYHQRLFANFSSGPRLLRHLQHRRQQRQLAPERVHAAPGCGKRQEGRHHRVRLATCRLT